MKEIKTYFYSILLVSIFLVPGSLSYGQGKEIDKTYQWKQEVSGAVKYTFSNYDCKLTVHTWDRSEIEYKLSINATLKSEEDARELDAFIKNLEFSASANHVEFNNRFWTGKKVIMGRKTMTLKGNKSIRFSEFRMEGEMWIPENCFLNLNSKYAEIYLEDLNGRLNLDLYNDKVYGKSVGGHTEINAKYSKLEFTGLKDINADFYNTDLEAATIANLNIQSKYSNFRVGDAGEIDMDSYSDKYFFENTGDIKFIAKYSDLDSKISGDIELDCYNSTVNVQSAQTIDLISKYGKYAIDGCHNLNISSAYNDTYKLASIASLRVSESKYSVFKIDHLEKSLLLKDGYSDKFFISKTGDIKEVKLTGKYVLMELALDKALSYKFEADVKYPKFNIHEEDMDVKRKIKEGSDLKMEAIKGVESEGMPAFFVNGYEMAITLTEEL
jgi:hypothetical protein